jgi:arginine repressor
MPNRVIKDTLISNETIALIPQEVLQSGILNSGKVITQTVMAKWLREIHAMHVTSMPSYIGNKEAKKHYFELSFMGKVMQMGNQFGYYDTYEEALETGLQQALKLVVKKIENEK